MAKLLQVDLPGVKGQIQLRAQKRGNAGYQRREEAPVLVDNHEIIHVAPVVPHAYRVLDVVIQRVEVKVGQDLAGGVAGRDAPG